MSEHMVSESTPVPDQPRVAIVTGAATGIGRAAAEVFADRGYALVAVDISTEALAWTRDREGIRLLVGDVSDDALAGRGRDGAVRSHHGRERARSGVGNPARGPRHGRPWWWRDRCHGINLVKAAAIDFGARGVRVNAVAPGPTLTPILRGGAVSHERLEALRRPIPLQRLARPQEQAEVIWFLGTPASSFVTGTTVMCDGGITANAGIFLPPSANLSDVHH